MSGVENAGAVIPELDNLAGEALEVDALIAPQVSDQNPPIDTEHPPAPQIDRTAEAKAIIGILRPLIVMAFPVVKDAPDSEWEALQQPTADCLAFYNVDVSKWLAHPLAALAFASVPLVMRGVNNWQAAQKKQPDAPVIEQAVDVKPAEQKSAQKFQSRA